MIKARRTSTSKRKKACSCLSCLLDANKTKLLDADLKNKTAKNKAELLAATKAEVGTKNKAVLKNRTATNKTKLFDATKTKALTKNKAVPKNKTAILEG